ncbi:MAG: DUF4395 domain-containing protein [Candidatus Kapaibacterium sp.]
MNKRISTHNEFTGAAQPFNSVQRHRLEMQGYLGYSDHDLSQFGYWTRLAPGLCAAIGVVGTILTSEAIIWMLAAISLLGAASPRHPFDWLYNKVLRHPFGTYPVPHHGRPRRFACTVATVWLVGTGVAFYLGDDLTGYILGVLFVIIASVPAVIGFCIPSYIYRRSAQLSSGFREWRVARKFGS